MTLRARLARWLVKHDPDWTLVLRESAQGYEQMQAEEAKVRALIRQHAHLASVESLLTPQKKARTH